MRLFAALILFMSLSTACGLQCYLCRTTDPKPCTRVSTCPEPLNTCFAVNVAGFISKGCGKTTNCQKPMTCCQKDLCNSAIPTGPSIIFLLVSSAITTLFV